MKRTATTLLMTVALAGFAMPAFATNQPYLGLSGDLTWIRHQDMGGGGDVQLGWGLNQSTSGGFRVEAEAGYHGADNTHYMEYMGNVYYDFGSLFPASSTGGHVVPYLGAGIGDVQSHEGSNGNNITTTFHHHNNDFAYQGMAGLGYTTASMPNTDWSIGYRYLSTDNSNVEAHNVEAGVRFHF